MKLLKLQNIVPDENLQKVLWGSSGEKAEKQQLVENLFSSASGDDILRLIAILRSSTTGKGTCKKLLAKIGDYASSRGEQSGLSHEQIDQIIPSCGSKTSKSKNVSPPSASITVVERAAPSSTPVPFDQFPGEERTFEALALRAEELKANTEIAQSIIEEINHRVRQDPTITSLTSSVAASMGGIASRSNPPFDFNRAARDIEGAFFNGSDVQTELQNFILFGCPRGPKDTADLFDTLISQKTRVIVSLNGREEAKSRYYNFWESERLATLSLRNGWTIEKTSEKILDQKPCDIIDGETPKIVESTLLATKDDQKIEITHLHYEGWPDKSPMPSEDLLNSLYDRIEEINKRIGIDGSTPIAINCKAGVGRTGTVAVGWHLRRYIDKCLSEGKGRSVNIPQIIYQFRRQRSGIIGQGTQLAQVYSLAARYYCHSTS